MHKTRIFQSSKDYFRVLIFIYRWSLFNLIASLYLISFLSLLFLILCFDFICLTTFSTVFLQEPTFSYCNFSVSSTNYLHVDTFLHLTEFHFIDYLLLDLISAYELVKTHILIFCPLSNHVQLIIFTFTLATERIQIYLQMCMYMYM